MAVALEQSLINQFFMICRAARTANLSHEAFARPIANLRESLRERGAPFSLELDPGGGVIGGDVRQNDANAEWLALVLERGKARRIVIDAEVAEADLRELLRAMLAALEFRDLAESVASSGARGIHVDSLLLS